MSLPINLRIIGRDTPVIKVDELPERYGEFDYNTFTIKIQSGQHPLAEADTLLHECIHAIDDCFQLKMTERQVYCTATGIIALMRDNKEFVQYLMNALENPRNV